MVKTIEEGFREFLGGLTHSDTEISAVVQHRASIDVCLRQNLDMTTLFRTGSFGLGTSIYGYSDIDYFAEMPTDRLSRNSSHTLQKLKNILQTRFANIPVSVRTPAVALFFGGGEHVTEIVPANYLSTDSSYGGDRIYEYTLVILRFMKDLNTTLNNIECG